MNSAAATLRLGDDAGDRQYRAVLSFDTSGLPDHAVIQSAVLSILQVGPPVGTDPFSVLGNLRVDIHKGAFSGGSNLELTDFNAAPSAGAAPFNATGLSKINQTGLTQLRLRFATITDNNGSADFMSFESGDAFSMPILLISFTVP